MKFYKIGTTYYRFLDGTLLKVGSTKQLGDASLISPSLPQGSQLKGRQQVSQNELFHIGKKDANLSESDVERLHNIRNGFDSHEEFLNQSPEKGQYHTLYHSPNIELKRKANKHLHPELKGYGRDEINATVEGRLTRKNKSKSHTKELGNVVKAFNHFTRHPSGERIFTATPDGETNEEVESKAKFYKKMGRFQPIDKNIPSLKNRLFANHASPSHLIEDHNNTHRQWLKKKLDLV